ncbi:MAG: pyruvate kinase [Clostridia bacterium]|nr:pyruvate kinase [Clostridia bacterium]
MKKTKIICTLGPASETETVISALFDAGMNVARLNFSHGTHAEHAKKIAIIHKIREERHIPLPVMLDTKGPEFRIRTFRNQKITLKKGDTFTFTTEDIVGDETRVSVSYQGICEELQPGDKILLNNGLISFEVKEVRPPEVITEVLIGGETSDHKSMFFPDKELHMDYLSEQDKKDLAFGVEQGVEFIACSFVSKAQDILDVKSYLKELGGEHIDVIAKIENRAGVRNLEEIINACEGIMVARGDLGVEIPFEELPDIQKHIITTCRIKGKRVITATEMLESMIKQPRPTRAEISDVANAVYDGSSAVMLSGETAAGLYPVEAVEAMSRICIQAEKNTQYIGVLDEDAVEIHSLNEALSHSACTMAHDIGAKCIVVCTRTGTTARMVSRFRPLIDIIGMTTDEKAYQQLALSWGVIPMMAEEYSSVDVLFHFAKRAAKDSGLAKPGDMVVITGGNPNGKSGNSSLINIERI